MKKFVTATKTTITMTRALTHSHCDKKADIEAKKHEWKNVEIPSQNIYFGVSLGFVTHTYTCIQVHKYIDYAEDSKSEIKKILKTATKNTRNNCNKNKS